MSPTWSTAAVLVLLSAPASAAGERCPGPRGTDGAPDAAAPQILPAWPRRPDPKPLVTAEYLRISIEARRGGLRIAGVVRERFAGGPRPIARFRGRYAVELYTHALLRDVVRFDLPLAGLSLSPAPHDTPSPPAARAVSARLAVTVPFDSRITGVRIVDTATGKKVSVPLSKLRRGRPQLSPPVPNDLRTRSFGRREQPAADRASSAKAAHPAQKTHHRAREKQR